MSSSCATEVLSNASFNAESRFLYQSMCFDQVPQPPGPPGPGHCVSSHVLEQAGHFPEVSKVFHSCPQVQHQCGPPSGSHSHAGQAILICMIINLTDSMRIKFVANVLRVGAGWGW